MKFREMNFDIDKNINKQHNKYLKVKPNINLQIILESKDVKV